MAHITDGPDRAVDEHVVVQMTHRENYVKPRIILELELENRAGTPVGFADPYDPLAPFDPLGLGRTE